MGAEVDLLVVHREVGHATPQLEQGLAGVAVPLVLLNGVRDRLPGEAVLELEREDGQPVDEQRHVQRPLGLVPAVAELAGDAEPVLAETPPGRLVVGRRGAVEQVDVVGAVPDAVAEHGNDAVFGDFPLQPGQELAAGGTVVVKLKRGSGVRLGGVEERAELDQVDAVFPVVIVTVARRPAVIPCRRRFADGGTGGGDRKGRR